MTDDLRGSFLGLLGFTPDEFQVDAMDSLDAGRSVLVAAPTGAGKTVVGEYACHRALQTGKRCFYTTPIKALSNQKLRDLQERYGEAQVGLLTGDRSVNPDAPIVVMTTEVLRNMIYEGRRDLSNLQAVVLDEVHYLADRARGAVWEEVIIQVPSTTQVVSLSATVSNAEEFGDWLDNVRNGCDVIISEHRPVPLRHHYFVNDKLYPTFRTSKQGKSTKERKEAAAQARAGVPNPDVLMLEQRAGTRNRVSNKGRRQGPAVRMRWPDRPTAAAELRDRGWLPAIVFVFSRAGCDKAVQEMMAAGARMTTPEEADEIQVIVDTLLVDIPAADLAVLGYGRFLAALRNGVAAHHAGMVPAFKEAVEVCFQTGLLKLVYATETLALGINMPARTVVIERLEKWNGETHELLTAGQYTQLTGRAGRRGLDEIGNAVVLHQRDLPFRTVAGLVGRRTYPLHSSFAPAYNMAVNMLRHHTLDETRALLEQSFAQHQANSAVGSLADELVEAERGLDGYDLHLECDKGDWDAYWAMRRKLTDIEKAEARERRRRHRSAVEEGLESLQPGDVLVVPGIGRHGLVVVTGMSQTRKGSPLAQVVTEERALARIGTRELSGAPNVISRVRLPARGNPRQVDYRKAVGLLLSAVEVPAKLDDEDGTPQGGSGTSDEIEQLRTDLRAHPCHACEDRGDHERWQRRTDVLLGDSRQLRERIKARTGDLVRTMDKVLRVLTDLGYVDETHTPTADGMRLAGIHSEVDLLVAEAVNDGVLEDLTPAELAAAAAILVYEPRGDDATTGIRLPTRHLDDVADELDELATMLRKKEQAAGLPVTRDLDLGFAGAAYRWASGRSLEESIGDLELTGGDFVRTIRHLADLVGQLRYLGDEELADTAEDAVHMLRRGIVDI